MREQIATVHRLSAFSDAVIAVVITIMVLELKAPDSQSLSELWSLWPTAMSYAVSYLFIAIIWINHHYLMRFVDSLTPKLVWINFAHLFVVSLLPFATAWIARTQLASTFMRRSSCAWTSLTMCSSGKYSPKQGPPRYSNERNASRGADHSLFLESSQAP